MKRCFAVLIGVAVVVALNGEAVAAVGPLAGVGSRVLTPDGFDSYQVDTSATSLRVRAPADNAGSNLRQVWWPAGGRVWPTGEVCATWSTVQPESAQPGLAVLITQDRAVTVTRNVWGGAYWVLNVHTWRGPQFEQVAQFDVSSLVLVPGGGLLARVWRLCARVDRLPRIGTVSLSVKLWLPAAGAEPAWSTPGHVWSALLPADGSVPAAGRLGWYGGHVPAGGQLFMTGLAVRY